MSALFYKDMERKIIDLYFMIDQQQKSYSDKQRNWWKGRYSDRAEAKAEALKVVLITMKRLFRPLV